MKAVESKGESVREFITGEWLKSVDLNLDPVPDPSFLQEHDAQLIEVVNKTADLATAFSCL